MISIDEAIANAREVAEEIRENIIDGDNLEPYESYCNAMVDKSAEEHEHLAEWLELLKWYQQWMEDIPSESGVFPKDVYHAGYNKAIDDLIAKCENAKFAESDEISLSDIHTGVNSGLSMAIHFAEQLKAGEQND